MKRFAVAGLTGLVLVAGCAGGPLRTYAQVRSRDAALTFALLR